MKKDNKQEKETFLQKLDVCEKEKQEFLEGWQRSKADFLNYKKEESVRMDGLKSFVRSMDFFEMLKVFDNLEMATKHLPKELEDNEWVNGVLQIKNQFLDALKNNDIEEIKALGENFDHNLHEAIAEEEDKNQNAGIIIGVVQKGYKLNGRVLRPARVRVAK